MAQGGPNQERVLKEVGILLPSANSANTLDDADLLKLFIANRTNIRTSGTAHLNTCGFLLTFSLGALYFLITDSKLSTHIPSAVKYLIFFAAFLLALSIVIEHIAIHAKPIKSIEPVQILDNESDHCLIEVCWARLAFFVLMGALVLLILSFGLFIDGKFNDSGEDGGLVENEHVFVSAGDAHESSQESTNLSNRMEIPQTTSTKYPYLASRSH